MSGGAFVSHVTLSHDCWTISGHPVSGTIASVGGLWAAHGLRWAP